MGVEHILLGLAENGVGVADGVVSSIGIPLAKIRSIVRASVLEGSGDPPPSRLPATPQAKKVFDFAHEEAESLRHSYIDEEHVLLGVLRVHDGIADRAFAQLGVNLEAAREKVRVAHLTMALLEIERRMKDADSD